eukprot:11775853-Alexandrium_andersonii.AAC.1
MYVAATLPFHATSRGWETFRGLAGVPSFGVVVARVRGYAMAATRSWQLVMAAAWPLHPPKLLSGSSRSPIWPSRPSRPALPRAASTQTAAGAVLQSAG